MQVGAFSVTCLYGYNFLRPACSASFRWLISITEQLTQVSGDPAPGQVDPRGSPFSCKCGLEIGDILVGTRDTRRTCAVLPWHERAGKSPCGEFRLGIAKQQRKIGIGKPDGEGILVKEDDAQKGGLEDAAVA